MYQMVEGQPSAEEGIREDDDEASPEGSITRSTPRNYWGNLDTAPDPRTLRPSFSDTFELLEQVPQENSSPQPRSKAASSPVAGESGQVNPWTPGVLARIPRLGFLAIIFNIMMTVVSIVVLVLSNNSPTDHWNKFFQPSVWLSATCTLANMSSTLTLAQGLIIAFWRKAGKGATLADLHLTANGSSLFTAIASARHSSRNPGNFFITLACLLSTLSAFRGPIVQRASTVVSVAVPTTGNMTLNVAQILSSADNPLAYINVNEDYTSVSYLSQNFTSIVKDFTDRKDIPIEDPYCGDSCEAVVEGFGFKPTCETGTFEFEFHDSNTFANVTTVFNSSVYYAVGSAAAENSPITLNVTYLNNGIAAAVEASSTKVWHNCTLQKAIVGYPVVITGSNITLQTNRTWNYLTDPLQDWPITFQQPNTWGGIDAEVRVEGTITGGFGFYLSSLFNSSGILSFNVGDDGYGTFYLDSTGLYANQYMELGDNLSPGIQSTTKWSDPIPDMLDTINQLTFRTAVVIAQRTFSPEFHQNITYSGVKLTTVYKSNFALMGVAVAVNFLGLLAILPVYYGWWELGRNTSLSPLETAKAFGAPLLRDVDGNATAEQILKKVGERRVKYGETFTSGGEGDGLLIPRKGMRGRLQIVEEMKARAPEVGNVFGADE